MVYFYLYIVLFIFAACLDIGRRRFMMLPIALSSAGALILLILNVSPMAVFMIWSACVICMYVLQRAQKKK